jgi:RimJ/RimL family protein N-acetyltransferase
MSKFKKLDSIIHVKIPAAMEVDNIRLRRLRFSDGPFIMNELKDEIILNASGLLRPIHVSWFSLWWWMKTTFMFDYCIEFNLKPIGFIGLYDLLSGESAQISLTIFDKMFRRQGYGSRAFNLLAKHLQKHSIVREIRARVMRDNHDAVSFWRKIGFSQMDTVDAIQITMSMHLKTTS